MSDNPSLQKYKNDLDVYRAEPNSSWSRLKVALCYIKLHDFTSAQINCLAALNTCSFRNEPGYRIFVATSEIEKIAELYLLAGQPPAFLPQLVAELESYKQDARGNSLVAHYAYALLALLQNNDDQALRHVDDLKKYPKEKDIFAAGEMIQAIGKRDQLQFKQSLNDLLRAHCGKAKFGGLRETPERYICLSAMCLIKLARERGFVVNVENEYLSLPYLEFLD